MVFCGNPLFYDRKRKLPVLCQCQSELNEFWTMASHYIIRHERFVTVSIGRKINSVLRDCAEEEIEKRTMPADCCKSGLS